MKKLVLIAALALFGFGYVFAQNVDLVDYQWGNATENILAGNDNVFGGSTATLENTETSNLIFTNIEFAIMAGLVQSTIIGDQADSYDCRTCFMVGMMIFMPINEFFAIQPEVVYACMGSGYFEAAYGETVGQNTRALQDLSGDVKLSYLQIPIMAKYFVIDGLSLEAGPQVAFLLSAKDEYTFGGMEFEDDIKDFTKGVEFGVNAGVGYRFNAGYHIRARYLLGLSEINDGDDFETGASWKNSSFQFSVGYFF